MSRVKLISGEILGMDINREGLRRRYCRTWCQEGWGHSLKYTYTKKAKDLPTINGDKFFAFYLENFAIRYVFAEISHRAAV